MDKSTSKGDSMNNPVTQVNENIATWKAWGDALSFMNVFGTLMEFLPSISALLSVIWMILRIYETDTIQKLVKKEDDDA